MKDPRILSRISIFYAVMLVIGGLIIVKVGYLQFFAKDTKGVRYSEKSQQVNISERETKPNRGSILSHDGRLLATSLPSYILRMDFLAKGMTDSIFQDKADSLSLALAGYFKDKSAVAYKREIQQARQKALAYKQQMEEEGKEARAYVKRIVSQKVNYLQLQEIKRFPFYNKGSNVGGLVVDQESVRVYPYQGMAYRTIGYLNTGNKGTGIERSFDEHLAGIKGKHIMQRTAGGEFIPIDSDENIEPKDGCDVISTLDVDIQDAAETALRRQLMKESATFEAGTVVVMETQTGEIRAIANMKRNADGSFNEAYNYAIGEASEPGSTFKLASLIAALETGDIDIDDEIDCGTSSRWKYKEFTFRESFSTGLGKVTVQKIIEKSSNVGVAKMVLQVFDGKESKFVDCLNKMNLNEKFNLDIDGEATPFIKHPKKDSKHWSAYSMPQMATGYELKLAPIHTLTLYNAIANNGKMVKPKLVNEIRRHGRTEQKFPTQVLKESICSRKTAAKVQSVLEGVVENGTARNIKNANYKIAGKTGTAQIAFGSKGYVRNGMKRHQASFCGYFPADNPKFSCIVVLYTREIPMGDNFYGGTWAAPVFKEIADKIYATQPSWHNPVAAPGGYYVDLPQLKNGRGNEVLEVVKNLNIPFVSDKSAYAWAITGFDDNKGRIEIKENTTENNIMPLVEGMGLKDALYLLEGMGMKVSFSGKGTVHIQSMAAGEKFRKGQKVTLTLEI